MTPGGNDVLVLHSIPQLSAHALPAYLAMTAGIAIVLIVMRATRGVFLEVDCRYDVRRTRWFAPLRRARPETDLATNVARGKTGGGQKHCRHGDPQRRSTPGHETPSGACNGTWQGNLDDSKIRRIQPAGRVVANDARPRSRPKNAPAGSGRHGLNLGVMQSRAASDGATHRRAAAGPTMGRQRDES
jgi:hypothetical protein